MNDSPSTKHYEPVQHQEELHRNDSSDEDNDFHHIGIDNSNDSDDKTAPTSNIHHHLSFDLEEEEDELQRYRLPKPGSRREIPKNITLPSLWQMYLDARLEGRRRRAEQLLENDSPFICLSSWCDLTDRGLFLYLLLFVGWIVACVHHTSLLVGGLFFVLRLVLRPAYWFIWGRRIEQKRQETMAIYDELNGNLEVNNIV